VFFAVLAFPRAPGLQAAVQPLSPGLRPCMLPSCLLAHAPGRPRLVLVCGDALRPHAVAATADLARRLAEAYNRPYLAPSLRDRTLCMLCAALGAAAAAAAATQAAAEAADGYEPSNNGTGAASAALAGPASALEAALVAALAEEGLAENLAAYAELCCACWWEEGEAKGAAAGAAACSRDDSALGAAEWAAVARGELAAKALGLAAALAARSAGASGGGGEAQVGGRRVRGALAKLMGALSAFGRRFAVSPLPSPGPQVGAAAAAAASAERRASTLRALRSCASGLVRAGAVAPVACTELWLLPSTSEVGAWASGLVREAAAGDAEDERTRLQRVAGDGTSGGAPLVHVDWACLSALLELLELLESAAAASEAAANAAAGRPLGGTPPARLGPPLPPAALSALLPAVVQALRWTTEEGGLVHVARCAGPLWRASLDAPAEQQVGAFFGDSAATYGPVCRPY
jgi:hypothetical protein